MSKVEVEEDLRRLVASIGSSIRKQRNNKGMTQEQLAELAGINEKYLSSIENGNEANLSIGYLVRISKALDISLTELFPEGG